MINLLLNLVFEKEIGSSIVKEIKERVSPDHFYMVVGDTKELPIFENLGDCILRDNAYRGIYDDQLELEENIPIDDSLLRFMNQHSMEIMHQQRRFEHYPVEEIDESWNSHYTIYMHNLFFWYNFLIKKQITHVFLSLIPHEGYDITIYYLCRFLNIKLQMVHSCIIPFRRFPLKDFLDIETVVKEEYEMLQAKYKEADISDIPLEGKTAEVFERWASLEPDKMKPWYMRVNPFKRRLRQRFFETNIIRIWRGMLGEDYVKYGFGGAFIKAAFGKFPKLIAMIPVAFKRWRFVLPIKRKSIRLNAFYESLAKLPKEGERYIYFPLHYQPEATSNPMGGDMYADQILALNILSQALPKDMKIYVKSHPEQLALMITKEYYKDMARIPRVLLMKKECSTFDLMKNAVAVSTLTGTALWECQFFGIPAIVFGYSLKNPAPLSYPVRTVEECQKAIGKILDKGVEDKTRELKIYTKAMHNISFPIEEREKVLPGLICNFIAGKDNVLEGIEHC